MVRACDEHWRFILWPWPFPWRILQPCFKRVGLASSSPLSMEKRQTVLTLTMRDGTNNSGWKEMFTLRGSKGWLINWRGKIIISSRVQNNIHINKILSFQTIVITIYSGTIVPAFNFSQFINLCNYEWIT